MSSGNIKPKFNDIGSYTKDISKLQNMSQNIEFRATNTTVLSNQTNHTLYIKDLWPHTHSSKLTKIFQPYKGFREVRHISEKGVAFIEFDNHIHAEQALIGLSNYRMDDGNTLNVSYARK